MFKAKKFENLSDTVIPPFKIIGNVYFVGSYSASTHLIDTGDGLILIDPGYKKTFPFVLDSLKKLGFCASEIKYAIATHWHGDHAEAMGELLSLCNAKTLIGKDDSDKVRRYFDADVLVKDGDCLVLGNTKIEFHETPGHTKGTISFFFNTEDGERSYRVGSFGGAGQNTLVPGKYDFDGAREAYFTSIERLKKEKVDVFIGNHVWNNNTDEYGKLLKATGENRFIDPSLWISFLNNCELKLKKTIKKEQSLCDRG